MTPTTLAANERYWYKDAVIYELHIKAFFDSNGDGIGDFGGLLQKLDYLQELGVTAIWVLPFYPSPLRDDGYDIADYYTINPRYGSLDEFRLFLQEAHKRNLKVITELVINHTSDQHPWFQQARRAPKDSPERAYYVWSDDPSKFKDVRIIFTDYETSNWTWDPVAGQYYWHRFFHHQPDLNYDNPAVQEEIFKIIDYWCAMGVDGFRLDAVPYLYEREGTNGENLPETHAFLKKLRKHIDEFYPATCFLAEANMWPEDSASYFGNGDECHMNYHFPVMPRMYMALQKEDRFPITDIFAQTPSIPASCQWAVFLRNHDELTLEMVTDEERDYMYRAYAKDPKARINLGIRHRLAPLLNNDRRRIELMNSLLFSLPGTPVLYYGDEIGMGDNFYLGDRDGVRTPMQWSPDRNAGFSNTNPQKLYLPVISDPQYHYESVNVETQRANTSSLFWYMKRMINLRKKHKAFGRGDLEFLSVDNPKILAFTRTFEDETLLIIVNLSKYSQPAEVELKDFAGCTPVELFSKNPFPAIKQGQPYFFTLDQHAYKWFTLQKPAAETEAFKEQVQLKAEHWDALFMNDTLEVLQNKVLPNYLPAMPWFTGKSRTIYSTTVFAHTALPVDERVAEILLLEAQFESGQPEYYHLPVLFVTGEEGAQLSATYPGAIISKLQLGDATGFLCDAVYTTALQHTIFDFLANKKRFMAAGEIVLTSTPEVLQHFEKREGRSSRVQATSDLHTAIIYDNTFFFKLYRKVDVGIHPDVELTRFLTGTGSDQTTLYAGEVTWQLKDGVFVLGMLERLQENHGDGYHYMLERVANFIERILARNRTTVTSYPLLGSLTQPVTYDELNDELKEFIGSGADTARLAGRRLARVHKALSGGTEKDFLPESFSLHYQRSLFSSMTSAVREMADVIVKNKYNLPEEIQEEVKDLTDKKEHLLITLRRIYAKKLDVQKIRTHGNFGLSHMLLTGKDVLIHDFGGQPSQPYSQRRLKRSPVLDITAGICSFYAIAYEGFLSSSQLPSDEQRTLLPLAQFWAHYMSGFFIKAYMDEAAGTSLLPADPNDFKVLMQSFLIENALQWFAYEVRNRPKKAMVPLRIIQQFIV